MSQVFRRQWTYIHTAEQIIEAPDMVWRAAQSFHDPQPLRAEHGAARCQLRTQVPDVIDPGKESHTLTEPRDFVSHKYLGQSRAGLGSRAGGCLCPKVLRPLLVPHGYFVVNNEHLGKPLLQQRQGQRCVRHFSSAQCYCDRSLQDPSLCPASTAIRRETSHKINWL